MDIILSKLIIRLSIFIKVRLTLIKDCAPHAKLCQAAMPVEFSMPRINRRLSSMKVFIKNELDTVSGPLSANIKFTNYFVNFWCQFQSNPRVTVPRVGWLANSHRFETVVITKSNTITLSFDLIGRELTCRSQRLELVGTRICQCSKDALIHGYP